MSYEISYRIVLPQPSNWVMLPPQASSTVDISPVEDGATYEISITAINGIGVRSPAIMTTHVVIGKTAKPSDVTGFSVNIVGNAAYLSWDSGTDLDTNYYILKYSPLLTGATWSGASTVIPQVSGTSAQVAAMVGTYLIKRVDTTFNESVNASSIVTNVVALEGINAVANIVEDPIWTGTFVDTRIVSAKLELRGGFMSTWSPLADVHSLHYGDINGPGIVPYGEYYFANRVDLGLKATSRITTSANVVQENVLNVMAVWTTLSSLMSMSGSSVTDCAFVLQIRTSDDDITFSAWREFLVGDYSARIYEFRALLYSYNTAVTPEIINLSVSIDMPDRISGATDVVCTVTGLSVLYSPAFKAAPSLAISAQGLTTGDYYVITAKTSTGFTIIFRDSTNAAVQRTFDWVAKGYGYVI